jgi:hypothetical protein
MACSSELRGLERSVGEGVDRVVDGGVGIVMFWMLSAQRFRVQPSLTKEERLYLDVGWSP